MHYGNCGDSNYGDSLLIGPPSHAATSTYTEGAAYTAAVDTRDALGRVTSYIEYTASGSTAFSSAYNNDNLETSETETAGMRIIDRCP